ncbi:MAG: transglycosylase domain-containing protein [Oscillatoria sp. Prado101]|jgi:penicillin-binding protein 1C|nr:transglycosylase domain-containing protein [Oscillatoria sp. Prado101]
MKNIPQLLAQIQHSAGHRLSRKNRQRCKILLTFALLCLTVRTLPYLAPIRARDIAQDRQAIEFTDRNGLPLGTLLTRDQEHTAVAPLNQISPHFIRAIIAAEDQRFYHHGALDMRAIARSLLEAAQAKQIVSGASTITMQLARMLDASPPTFPNKFREIWLAWRIAAGMNRDEILSAYINRLPMGGNIYGVEAASRTYFGIPAADLNLARASILAALPNDPTYLNPYDNWQSLKKRQAYVLDRMVKDKYITRNQADRALAEEILLQPRRQGIIAAPHFLFWLASQLPKQHPSQIKTTLDRPLQQFVEAQIEQIIRALAPKNAHHAAALVIDNRTGEILAYAGSPDYFNEAQMGRNDGVQALRQPGSTLKPFLYELALEKRIIRPNTILADVPAHYAIPGAKLYSPTNYNEETFLGPVRVRVALANSLNVPAVRVLEKAGVGTFLDRLHQLGFNHLKHPADYYGLGLTLGSGEVSLWELARAYLTLARQGKPVPAVTHFSFPGSAWEREKRGSASLLSCAKKGSVSLPIAARQSLVNDVPRLSLGTREECQETKEIDSPATWALIADILSDRHARAAAFGVDSVLNLPFPAAVKTGTSSDFRDTWTLGFTTDYTVATWVGNFNGDSMRQVSGVTGAAPLWNRIMLHLHEHQEPAGFPPPKNLAQRPICAITGWRPAPDCPSVVWEYFYPEDLSAYEHQSGSRQLSPEYNEWLATQPHPTFSRGLKIVFPKNDDYFLLNQRESSRLEFKLAGAPAAPVEWWLNGKKLAAQSSPSLFWPMTAGEWTLQVRMGEISDEVRFQVQLGESRPTRRGFSIRETKK